MKRLVKIMVPILMVFVILFSIVWYLFIYDTQFTRDMLLNQARYWESKGNLSVSTWFYDLAYKHSGKDEAVAIELAQQFKNAGNYTKAEHTLTTAIADGGSVDVYVALCQTFVEQNKLLDAVNMLDNVSNSTIFNQLDVMRPAAPTANLADGVYHDYIQLTLSAPNCTIYYTTDGSYPSKDSASTQMPIELPQGATIVRALCIDQNGLVSPLVEYHYIINDIVEDTFLEDPVLEQWVRDQLKLPADQTLSTEHLWTFTDMVLPQGVTSLADLSKFTKLTSLLIKDGKFDNFSALSELSELQELTITGIPLNSQALSAIAQLPKLTALTLSNCSLSGINELAAATGLIHLDLSKNMIGNLSALSYMPNLTYVFLGSNAITASSLEALSGLGMLKELDLSHNSIEAVLPLAQCPGLYVLNLSNNLLSSTLDPDTNEWSQPLLGLEQLTELRVLSLANNLLTDVSCLSQLTNLMDLNFSKNQITDITHLSSLTGLCSLDFSENLITQLPQFHEDIPLTSINGSRNKLTSLRELQGLSQLAQIRMDDNAGITSVEPLADCEALAYVSLFRTGVEDVSCLKDLGIYIGYSKAES